MSNRMDDRIKLLEARGWVRREYDSTDRLAKLPGGNLEGGVYWLYHGDEYTLEDLPDPFTDANADCVVLEWYRMEHDCRPLQAALERLNGGEKIDYGVGDYARAVLTLLPA